MIVRFVLWKYSPMVNELNELIQRSVEHGFIRFYERMESFFKQLADRSSHEDLQMQSLAITMDNIWIYLYIFAAANCFSCAVFLCEILIFHRERGQRAIGEEITACREVIVFCWRKLLTCLRMLRNRIVFFWKRLLTILSALRNRLVSSWRQQIRVLRALRNRITSCCRKLSSTRSDRIKVFRRKWVKWVKQPV